MNRGGEFHTTFKSIADAALVTSALTLITSDDCHLCERARTLVDELGVEVREISIDSAEARGFAERGFALAFLPVLTDGRRVVAYGRFSEKRLKRELAL